MIRHLLSRSFAIRTAIGGAWSTHGDQIGSNVLATAVGPEPGAATRAGRNMFTAFGEPVASVLEAGEPSAVSSRYGYVGAFGYEGLDANQPAGFDVLAEAGFLHVGARHYDPATGRFIERDPIGIEGGHNVYAYAANLPTMLTDPDGEAWIAVVGRAAAAGGRYAWRGAKWGWEKTQPARQWLVENASTVCSRVKRHVRIEKHELPKYRNYGPVWHVNVGKKRIILDPRVIKDRLTSWW